MIPRKIPICLWLYIRVPIINGQLRITASFQKVENSDSYCASKPRKIRFDNNRFTTEGDEEELGTSGNAKKLSTGSTENIMNPLQCYRIIKFFPVFYAIIDILIFKSCI